MKIARMVCALLLLVSLVAVAGCPGNIQQGGSSSEESGGVEKASE
jgi:hypothetical protein